MSRRSHPGLQPSRAKGRDQHRPGKPRSQGQRRAYLSREQGSLDHSPSHREPPPVPICERHRSRRKSIG
ncbi:hypothetical protein HAX54_045019, partial [Datura stramonium]|nr:hypothetical protein [Datura stramonium]